MTTKLIVSLPDETVKHLKQFAESCGTTVTEAFTIAVQRQQFLDAQQRKGNQIILDGSNTLGACVSDLAFTLLHPFGPSPDPRRHWRRVSFGG